MFNSYSYFSLLPCPTCILILHSYVAHHKTGMASVLEVDHICAHNRLELYYVHRCGLHQFKCCIKLFHLLTTLSSSSWARDLAFAIRQSLSSRPATIPLLSSPLLILELSNGDCKKRSNQRLLD